MDPAEIARYIAATFPGVNHAVNDGDSFFIYDPDRNFPPNRQIPFATIVTNDHWDTASNLGRPGVYRLNIGLKKETYRAMFGEPPAMSKDGSPIDTGHDYTALDTFMPHPIYAAMGWISVLNPGEATWECVKPLLAEAYGLVANRRGSTSGSTE